MSEFSTVSSFEHRGDVVHVNASRSIIDGWSVHAIVVGRTGSGAGRPSLVDVAELAGLRFSTPQAAVEAGARVARAYLDRLGS